jgi:hypothetical protein
MKALHGTIEFMFAPLPGTTIITPVEFAPLVLVVGESPLLELLELAVVLSLVMLVEVNVLEVVVLEVVSLDEDVPLLVVQADSGQ